MMPIQPTQLVRANPSHVGRLAVLHRKAFETTTLYRTFYGTASTIALDKSKAKTLRLALSDPDQIVIVAVRGKTVLGYALWEKYGAGKVYEKTRPTFLPGVNVQNIKDDARQCDEMIEELIEMHPDGLFCEAARVNSNSRYIPHADPDTHRTLVCSFLAVDPACHFLGVGRALMRWGLAKAAEENRLVCLDCTEGKLAVCLSARAAVVYLT
jgi:GNAT superfamily N-acetyltransferase